MNLIAVILFLIAHVLAYDVSYNGYQVYRIHGRFKDLALPFSYSVWSESSEWKDIMVHRNDVYLLPPKGTSELLISNVGQLILDEQEHAEQVTSNDDKDDFFTKYQDLDTIYNFNQDLEYTSKIVIGKTYEGRPIYAFKYGNGPKHVVFNGNIHAREWITSAVVSYINQFLNSGNETAVQLRELYTFHSIPVLNPDGFSYTKTKDRLWRKNRKPNPGYACNGTDPNRNFDIHWNDKGGSSDYPCSEDYRGSSPFDSEESTAIATYISSLGKGKVISYLDFHSYSQLWMYPYGYTCNSYIKEVVAVNKVAQQAVDGIQETYGTRFTGGPICQTIYKATGSSTDYMYSLGIAFSYGVELRDTGKYGFILPANQIIASGTETLNGVIKMWNYIATL